jgi:hypothetical protein
VADRPFKTVHPKKRAFLAAYAETGNITRAAEMAEMSRPRHYEWLAADADYAQDFAAAEEQAGDRLEQAARARAVEGVQSRRLLLYRGEPLIDWSVPGKWVDEAGEDWQEGTSQGRKQWTGAFLCEVETKYSDTLLIFLLKGARPEKYAERRKIEVSADPRKEAEAIAAEIGKADDPAVVAQIERDLLISQEAR